MEQSPGLPPSLRPMTIGEIVNASMKLYRQHWKTVIAIAALVIVPISAVNAVLSRRLPEIEPGEIPTMAELNDLLSVVAVIGLIQLLTAPLLTGGLSWLAAKFYLGEHPTLQEALDVAVSKLLPLIWVSILTFLAVGAAVIVLLVPGILIGGEVSVAAGILLGAAAIAVAVVLSLRLTFGAPALIVEGVRGTGALKRSWALSRGRMGKIFLTLLLSFILVAIVEFLIAVPFGIIGDSLGGAIGTFFIFVGDAIAGTIATPFAMIVLVLLYFDARISKEGFDTGLLARDIEPSA